MSMEATTSKPRKAKRSSRSENSGTTSTSATMPAVMVSDQPTEK